MMLPNIHLVLVFLPSMQCACVYCTPCTPRTRVVGKWFWSAKRKFPIKYLSKSFAHSFMSASKYLTGKESQTFLSLHTHKHIETHREMTPKQLKDMQTVCELAMEQNKTTRYNDRHMFRRYLRLLERKQTK